MTKPTLKAGQKLWYKDKIHNTTGYVIVAEVTKDTLWVWYNGKRRDKPISVIEKTLFLTPQAAERRDTAQKSVAPKKAVSKPKHTPVYRKTSSYHTEKKMVVPSYTKEEPRFVATALPAEKSCDICVLRKNGSCGSLQNTLCEDYRPIQRISAEERNAYPRYGDATAIRKKDRNHFR